MRGDEKNEEERPQFIGKEEEGAHLDGLQVSPIQRRRGSHQREASRRMRGELGRGKPLSLLSKSQVGSSGELS
jgi:hypothetical protein